MTTDQTPYFNYLVDYSSKSSATPRVLLAKYGDGYEQRAGDGINNNPRSWPISITRDSHTIMGIEQLMDTWAGIQSFFWVTPRNTIARFVCRQYDTQYDDFNKSVFIGTFEQIFEGSTPVLYGGVLNDYGLVE